VHWQAMRPKSLENLYAIVHRSVYIAFFRKWEAPVHP
jgi:hypothetical protein